MEQREIIATINNLIETLKDGEDGFNQAAEAVRDPELRSLFSEYSRQRARFARELQIEVAGLGESKPETTSSVAGALHRAWINLKSAVTTGEDHAILAECERGEDSAVKQYQEALQANLPEPARGIVFRQNAEVRAAHDRIKELRDLAKVS
jgi:uncharacterized protein (TIGR02284 family)